MPIYSCEVNNFNTLMLASNIPVCYTIKQHRISVLVLFLFWSYPFMSSYAVSASNENESGHLMSPHDDFGIAV